MTEPEPKREKLETELAELTSWKGAAPGLWRRALDRRDDDAKRPSPWRWLLRTRTARVAAAVLIVGAAVLVVVEMSPSLRDVAGSAVSEGGRRPLLAGSRRAPAPAGAVAAPPGELMGGRGVEGMPAMSFQVDGDTPPLDPASTDRHVVRKATVELATDDVRSAFLRAEQLVSRARGEFVESSALTGEGTAAHGSLTLRVAASRLSEVLNALRGLGRVEREESNGDDVTGQVIDLDARLANERRVEAELLGLLDRRGQAPLEDILELRARIAAVRQAIEQLDARRAHLTRLVELATVLVIIRHEAEPPDDSEAGLGRYFAEQLETAWFSGIRLLADWVAFALRVLVGGLGWWVLLAVAIFGVRHLRRQWVAERAAA